MSANFHFDGLLLVGFLGQFFYFLRFFVQWYYTEKKKKVTIPISFWYLSITGAVIIFFYSYARGDIVFIAASMLSMTMYIRNLSIELSNAKKNRKRKVKKTI